MLVQDLDRLFIYGRILSRSSIDSNSYSSYHQKLFFFISFFNALSPCFLFLSLSFSSPSFCLFRSLSFCICISMPLFCFSILFICFNFFTKISLFMNLYFPWRKINYRAIFFLIPSVLYELKKHLSRRFKQIQHKLNRNEPKIC